MSLEGGVLLRGYKQYTYFKLYKNNRYLQYLLEYVPHSSGYNNLVIFFFFFFFFIVT